MDQVLLPTFVLGRIQNMNSHTGRASSKHLFLLRTSLSRTIRNGQMMFLVRMDITGDSPTMSHLLDSYLYLRRKKVPGLSPRNLLAISGHSRALRISLLSEYEGPQLMKLFAFATSLVIRPSPSTPPEVRAMRRLICRLLLTGFRAGTLKDLFEGTYPFLELYMRPVRDGLKIPSTEGLQSIML